MELNSIINQVDINRLYSHIYQLEGVRHPITAPKALDDAADYISKELQSYGYDTNKQEFKVNGFNSTFYNVEGYNSAHLDTEILVTSHYDTVFNTPGADDNASAVAIMLEAARILKKRKIENVRFVSFSLEEGNPAIAEKAFTKGKELQLLDEKLRPTSAGFLENGKKLFSKLTELRAQGSESMLGDALSHMGNQLSSEEKEYFTEYYQAYEKG